MTNNEVKASVREKGESASLRLDKFVDPREKLPEIQAI